LSPRTRLSTPVSRRDALLAATADYILEHGVSQLSLRPLAAAIGTKARLLIYHFGSRDALVAAALGLILERVQRAFLVLPADVPLDRAVLDFWRWATDRKNEPYLQLIFEVHGLAPRQPQMFGGYARGAFESWRRLLTSTLARTANTVGPREIVATSVMAVVDGLLLDYLATGDRVRTTRALKLFAKRFLTADGGSI
jgi:AcrR family transcriptional regulator